MTPLRAVSLVAALLFATVANAQPPECIDIPAVRRVDPRIGKVLADIDSRLPQRQDQYSFGSNTYRDSSYSTWAHEATHGVNSRIRNKYGDGTGTDNAFYILYGKGVIVKEPRPLTIRRVAARVPSQLRGRIFSQYLAGQQAASWNRESLYIVDEWTSYVNGGFATLEYVATGRGVGDSSHDVTFSVEMGIYSLVLAREVAIGLQQGTLKYDDKQFRLFVGWNWYRTKVLMEKSRRYPATQGGQPAQLLRTLQTSQDPQVGNLRRWTRAYFGKEWTQSVLGF